MAYKLVITRHADALLNRLVSYLMVQKQNPQAAGHLLDAVNAVYDRLTDNPLQFPISRDLWLEARHYRVAVTLGMNYIVVFKVEESCVTILGVFHGSENYPDKLN
jgi:plasmid stabilization system protein ParE